MTLIAEESDAETMKGGRGGGSLGLRMQLERMELVSHAGYAADAQKQMNTAPVQPHAPLNRSASVGAAMSVPSLSFPALSQQQQTSTSPASLPVRCPGAQFVV